MPGHDGSPYLENDTQPVPIQDYIDWTPGTGPHLWDPAKYSASDPNPLHGRVVYTHGLGVDQPLSMVRIGLNKYYPTGYGSMGGQPAAFAPFVVVPTWDWRGQADDAVFAGGASQHCQTFSGTA